ncbi:MAG: hypothetical protein F6K62_20995, partial [Sphaerospermopsis sp. SIO1G2]|nr:hypothetical protein [Sphaerospermopsis sp. SIO1G2]
MSNSIKASTIGLEIINKSRQRLGWTKTSTARWWQDAHTSRATLRRFWQGDRIQKEIFIAICAAVGVKNWQDIADIPETNDININPFPIYLDYHEAPNLESFYGRDQELEILTKWIKNSYKLINIYGIGGIGKTSLVLALLDKIQDEFKFVLWKKFPAAGSTLDFLNNLLKSFKIENNQIANTESLQIATLQ